MIQRLYRISSETAKLQEGQAQWGVQVLAPVVEQDQREDPGEQFPGLRQDQPPLGVGQPRLLPGHQPGEYPQGHRPDRDKEKEGWLLMAATKIRREPRRLTEEQKERLKDPKFILALKAVKPAVLENRRRQGVRRRTAR